jgi:O-antigen/teichoic acid export membrane protein
MKCNIEDLILPNRLKTLISTTGQHTFDITGENAKDLLTWNRLDLIPKFQLALEWTYLKNCNGDYAEAIYLKHIGEINAFIEVDGEGKIGVSNYLTSFRDLFTSMRDNGWKEKNGPIPLAVDGSILDGAHRCAIALALGIQVPVIRTQLAPHDLGIDYFSGKAISEGDINNWIITLVGFKKNVRAIVIYAANGNRDEIKFSGIKVNILHYQKLKLNKRASWNFIAEIYAKESWALDEDSGLGSIDNKHRNCFPNGEGDVSVLLTDSPQDLVSQFKLEYRKMRNIGNHSVHTTDQPQDTFSVVGMIFNQNSLKRLFCANLRPYPSFIKRILCDNPESEMGTILVGSSVLAAHGCRNAGDIDCLSIENIEEAQNKWRQFQTEGNLNIANIFVNPEEHLWYCGRKIWSIENALKYKKSRASLTDESDVELLTKLRENIDDALANENLKIELKTSGSINRKLMYYRGIIGAWSRGTGPGGKRKEWRKFIDSFADQAITSSGNFLLVALCAHRLQRQDLGVLGLVMAFCIALTTVNITSIFHPSAVQFPTENNRIVALRRILANGGMICVLFFLISGAGIYLSATNINDVNIITIIMSGTVTFSWGISDFIRRYCYLLHREEYAFISSFILHIPRLAVLSLPFHYSINEVLSIIILSQLPALGIFLSECFIRRAINFDTLYQSLHSFAKNRWYIASGGLMILHAHSMVFIINYLLTIKDVAVFVAIRGISQAGNAAMEIIETKLSVTSGTMYANDQRRFKVFLYKILGFGTMVWASGLLIVYFYSKEIIRLILPSDFSDYSYLLIVMWSSQLPVFMFKISAMKSRTFGNVGHVVSAYIMAICSLYIFALLLIPRMGILGVAYASLCSAIVLFLSVILAQRVTIK